MNPKTKIAIAALLLCPPLFANEAIFKKWDKDEDGFLSREEVPEGPRQIFDRKDVNGDGKISLDEHMDRAGKPKPPTKGKGKPGGTRGEQPDSGQATFTIQQTWSQEPDGFDRPVYAVEPKSKKKGAPVVIYFHGNGGDASRSVNSWVRAFPNRLVVAPQGYSRSWNIQGEKSKAPDVSFFRELIQEIRKRYPYTDPENVALIGSSNGGGMIYRLMIEIEEPLFRTAVPTVSSLLEAQYHDGSFWKSKDESDTDELDQKVKPRSDSKLQILYVHGTEDKVVPFDGGLRFGKYRHLSAYETANTLARLHGYQGKELKKPDGKEVGNGLHLLQFEGTKVNFLAVEDGSHGLQPRRDGAMEIVTEFINK